jgi:hypothetical protein
MCCCVSHIECTAGRTKQLQNLLSTACLLRHTTQALKLLQKLRQQLGASEAALEGAALSGGGLLDLAKAAKLISDVEAVRRRLVCTCREFQQSKWVDVEARV